MSIYQFILIFFNLVFERISPSQLVNTGNSDVRACRYSYHGTQAAVPVFCVNECVYTKDGEEASGNLYCFGSGDMDLDSECEVSREL